MKKNLFFTATLSFLLTCCTSEGPNNKTFAPTSARTTTITTATFTETNSRLIGRFDRNTTGQAKFTWPGSAIEFRFEGTKAAIDIASQMQVRFLINVDGVVNNLWVDAGSHHYPLVSQLTNGTHTIRLTRINESTAGVTSFISDPQVDGKLLIPPPAPQKRLLVIGDSITAGYGVEGANEKCHYTLDTSNQQLTYAALTANALGADLHTIAWSGIGAWRSYGEKKPTNTTILTRYLRVLADDTTSIWNTTQYTPDAILINIGTNDYWDGAVTDNYRLAMENLITKVQNDYTDKPIYLIVSPMLTNKTHESQKQVLTALANTNVRVLDLGENNNSEGFGCDYHPNRMTHARLGKALEKALKTDLKW